MTHNLGDSIPFSPLLRCQLLGQVNLIACDYRNDRLDDDLPSSSFPDLAARGTRAIMSFHETRPQSSEYMDNEIIRAR